MFDEHARAVEQLSSSLRILSLEETLKRASAVASHYGITRVTDTTQLDRLGIPVFASIRPEAEPNSVCVHAGKGVRSQEARVGAYMEAIEFAAVEFKRRVIDSYDSTPRLINDQPAFRARFVDLCPLLRLKVDEDRPLTCVDAVDIVTGERVRVPAELVFFPFNENTSQRIFGASTNGLCSGNSVDEATLHGLCEVIERDVQAFNFVHDRSRRVGEPYDEPITSLMRRVSDAGLECILRYTPNEYGLPYFQAFILEPSDRDAIAISQGAGCHPMRSIAAVRAVTEAAQSRLSYIHGGRDDLIERARFFAAQGSPSEVEETARMRARVQSDDRAVSYDKIPSMFSEREGPPLSIGHALGQLADTLAKAGFGQILRIVLTPPEHPAVVRVIVPKMESFDPSLKRIGPRLLAYTRANPK